MGTVWNKSGSIEFDDSGEVAAGAKAYFYVGGTTTPLAVYSDAAESSPRTSPVVATGGRWPVTFIPFCTSFDVKVTTSGGTQLYYYTNIPNPDPVEAATDTVTDDEKWQTGDVKIRLSTGTLTGYVRCNGRTIGSASSGASERANDDCQDLYEYLWNGFSDSILAVTGGRGGSAASDWSSNKPIALPNGRSAVFRGVDDMGNSAASLLGSATFVTGDATTGGSICGANTHTLLEAQLPSHTHSFSGTTGADGSHSHTGTVDAGGTHTHTGGTSFQGGHTHTGSTSSDGAHSHTATTSSDGAHTHSFSYGVGNYGAGAFSAINAIGSGAFPQDTSSAGSHTHTLTTDSASTHFHTFTTSSDGGHSHTFTTDAGGSHVHTFTTSTITTHTHTFSGTTGNGSGSGSAHNNVSRSMLGTYYIKL